MTLHVPYCTFETVTDRGRQSDRDKDGLCKLIKKSIPGIAGFGERACVSGLSYVSQHLGSLKHARYAIGCREDTASFDLFKHWGLYDKVRLTQPSFLWVIWA